MSGVPLFSVVHWTHPFSVYLSSVPKNQNRSMSDFKLVARSAVADPGFLVGGTPTTDVGAFQRKCVRKQTDWVPLSGGRWDARMAPPPLRVCQCAGPRIRNYDGCHKNILQYNKLLVTTRALRVIIKAT